MWGLSNTAVGGALVIGSEMLTFFGELERKQMAKLAFYTFGILRQPQGSALVQPFLDAFSDVFNAAQAAPGYIAHAVKPDASRHSLGQDFGAWGFYAVPRFYDGGFIPSTITLAATLSLWTGIAEVQEYAYSGLHGAALTRRREWFRKGDWPAYVMWWVADDEIPKWEQAVRKIEMLHDHGPTGPAFNFRNPF
jgi:hypothetical protein